MTDEDVRASVVLYEGFEERCVVAVVVSGGVGGGVEMGGGVAVVPAERERRSRNLDFLFRAPT